MKKMRKYLIMAIACLAIVACSDDAMPDGGDGGGGTIDPNGESWMSLSISPGKTVKTRSLIGSNDNQETGKANESKVNSVRIVLFNGFEGTSTVTNDVTLGTTDLNLNAEGSFDNAATSSTKGFKVSNSARSILVIVNPSSKLMATSTGSTTYATFNAAITDAKIYDVITADGGTGSTKDHFMMTNSKGGANVTSYVGINGTPTGLEPSLLTISQVNGIYGQAGDLTQFFKPTQDAAQAAPVSLKVDRVASKVRLYNAHSYEAPDDPQSEEDVTLNADDVEWTLNVTNKKFFPVSQRTYTYLENTYFSTKTIYDFHTEPRKVWSDHYGFGSYRVDPNYDNTGNPYTEGGNNTLYDENYDYVTSYVSSNWIDPTTGTADDPESGTNPKEVSLYCLENTQRKEDNRHAYTTHALVRAVIQPSHFREITYGEDLSNPQTTLETNTNINTATSWIKVNNGYYSFETLNDYITYELAVKYVNLVRDNPIATPTPITDAYIAYLAALGTPITISLPADKAAFQALADTEPIGTNAEILQVVKDKIITAMFPADMTGFEARTVGTTNTFTFYAGGVSYYKVMLKHDNDNNIDNNELGEFGVVRNAVYDIHITDFAKPGYPEPPLPDPDREDEGDMYLAAKIEINPWTWYKQSVILE